jgi:hypothetical protein
MSTFNSLLTHWIRQAFVILFHGLLLLLQKAMIPEVRNPSPARLLQQEYWKTHKARQQDDRVHIRNDRHFHPFLHTGS